MKKLILTLAAAALLVMFGMPGLLGKLAQNEIEAQLELTRNNPMLGVSIAAYRRGWFSSTVRYEIGFTDEYRKMLEDAVNDSDGGDTNSLDRSLLELLSAFELVSEISHGPVGFLDGLFFGLYRSATTESENNPRLNEFLTAARMPYLIRGESTTSLAGNTAFKFELPASRNPALNAPQSNTLKNSAGATPAESLASKLDFSGVTGAGNYSGLGGAGGHLKLTARLDKLNLKDKTSEFSLSDFAMTADSQFISSVVGLGPAKLSIGALVIKDRSSDNPVDVAMRKMTIATDVSVGKSEETLNMQMTYRIGEISIAEQAVSDVELKLALSEISALGLERYSQLMQGTALVQTKDSAKQEELLADVTSVMREFISKSPTVNFDPITLTASGEPLLAHLSINLNGNNLPVADNFDMLDPALWLQIVSGEAGLALSENMATLLAVIVAQRQLQAALGDQQEISPEQVSQMAVAQAPIILQTLVQQGLLQSANDQISAEVDYENGELLLNGQPVPLGTMLSL